MEKSVSVNCFIDAYIYIYIKKYSVLHHFDLSNSQSTKMFTYRSILWLRFSWSEWFENGHKVSAFVQFVYWFMLVIGIFHFLQHVKLNFLRSNCTVHTVSYTHNQPSHPLIPQNTHQTKSTNSKCTQNWCVSIACIYVICLWKHKWLKAITVFFSLQTTE